MEEERKGVSCGFVVAVVGGVVVVAFLLLPLLQPCGVTERSLRSSCASNLHQIGLALLNYAMDNGNAFPAVAGVVKATKDHPGFARPGDGAASLKLLYPNYVTDERIFQCPTTPPGAGEFSSYAYDPRHQSTDPPDVVLIGDRGGGPGKLSPNHPRDWWGNLAPGQNVLYIAGYAEWKKATNVGVGGDEIYVQNDELNNRDSWLIE